MMEMDKSKGISSIFICFTVSCVAVLLYIIMIPKEIAFESVTNKLKEETITIIPISKKEIAYNSLKIPFLFNMPTCVVFEVNFNN